MTHVMTGDASLGQRPPGDRTRGLASLRTWATPLTTGAFLLVAATGILMFFQVQPGFIMGAHKWGSWLFLIGVAGHVTVNFRPFTNHLKSRWGRSSVGLFAMVLAASCFTWGARTGGQFLAAIERDLVGAPLASLAVLTRTPSEVLVRRLEAHGIVARKEQTVRDLAGDSSRQQLRILEVVFLP